MLMGEMHCKDCGRVVEEPSCNIKKCVLCGSPLCIECGSTTQFNLDVSKGKVSTICETCYKKVQPSPEQWEAQSEREGLI